MKFRHIYLSDSDNKSMPVATLCSVSHDNVLRFAMSRCNPLDQFAKSSGRRVSQGRLERCKHLTSFNQSFGDRVQSLFSGNCVLFEKEEVPEMIKAVREELMFRFDMPYRELVRKRIISAH